MTSSTAIRPKDLQAGDTVHVEIDAGDETRVALDATVEKNTPKSGRVRMVPFGEQKARSYGYSSIVNIESVARQNGSVADLSEDDETRAERAEDALLDKAIGQFRMDVDPENYDEVALRDAVAFIEANVDTLDRAHILPAEISEMTQDQLDRVEQAKTKKAGLVGKALAEWIRTGDSGAAKAKADRVAKRAEREPRGLREGSTMWAVLEVLRKARKPLTAAEVAEKIISGKMAPGLKGKTPGATIAAAMNVAVARGQHGIVRPTPGHFELDRSK